VTTCAIYTRISEDKLADGHGVTNQFNDLARLAEARGWTVTDRLSDNDIGVTRKDPTAAAKNRPGYEERQRLRLVDAHAVNVVFCWRWDRYIRAPMELEYLIPGLDKASVRFAEAGASHQEGFKLPLGVRDTTMQVVLRCCPAEARSGRWRHQPMSATTTDYFPDFAGAGHRPLA
jgi:hypothetical protein